MNDIISCIPNRDGRVFVETNLFGIKEGVYNADNDRFEVKHNYHTYVFNKDKMAVVNKYTEENSSSHKITKWNWEWNYKHEIGEVN